MTRHHSSFPRAIPLLLLTLILASTGVLAQDPTSRISLTSKKTSQTLNIKENSELMSIKLSTRLESSKYFVISCQAQFEVEVRLKGTSSHGTLLCRGFKDTICAFDMKTAEKLGLMGVTQHLQISCQSGNEKCDSDITFSVADSIPVTFDTYSRVYTNGIQDAIIELPSQLKKYSRARVQVATKSPTHPKDEVTVRYSSSKNKNPSRTHGTILPRVVNNKMGTIIDATKKATCHKKDDQGNCIYDFYVDSKNLLYVDFTTSLIDEENELIYLNRYYYDKIPNQGEFRNYEFNIPEYQNSSVPVRIELVPISGNAELYANVDSAPLQLSSWSLQSTKGLSKNIVLQSELYNPLGGKDSSNSQVPKAEKVFIKVKSTSSAVYYLKVDYAVGPIYLSPGVSYTSEIDQEEIQQFIGEVVTYKHSQTFPIHLSLRNIKGNSDLYTMNCKTDSLCNIPTTAPNNLFNIKEKVRGVESTEHLKEISTDIVCGKKHHTYKIDRSSKFTEYHCMFAIGVKKTSQTSEVELTYSTPEQANIILAKHSIMASILKDEERIYVFQADSSEGDFLENVKVETSIDFGSVEITASSVLENPCGVKGGSVKNQTSSSSSSESESHKEGEVDNEMTVSDSLNDVNGELGEMNSELTLFSDKKVYVCVKATKYSTYTIKVIPVFANDRGNTNLNNTQLHSLPVGEQVFASVSDQETPLYFETVIDIPQYCEEEITFSLTPIMGTFRIVVSNKNTIPTSDQPFWNSLSNSVTISSRDPNYVSRSKHVIAVMLAQGVKGPGKFFLMAHTSNVHSKLKQGIQNSFKVSDGYTPTCMMIHIKALSSFKTLKISTSSAEPMAIYLSLSHQNSKPNRTKNYRFIAQDHNGIDLTSEEISSRGSCKSESAKCVLYMCTSQPREGTDLQVAYTYDNQPFTLSEGKGFSIPWMTSDSKGLNFLFYGRTNVDYTSIINSVYEDLDVFLNYNDTEPYSTTTPTAESHVAQFSTPASQHIYINATDSEITEFRFNIQPTTKFKDYINKLKEVFGSKIPNRVSKEKWTPLGDIEITSGPLTLHRGIAKQFSLSKDEAIFFRFTVSNRNGFILNLDSLSSSQGLMYLVKGTQTPSRYSFRKKSEDQFLNDVSFNQTDIHEGEEINGDYSLMVFAVKGGRFSLSYRPQSGVMMNLYGGYPTKVQINPQEDQFIQIRPSLNNQDIHITFESALANIRVFVLPKDYSFIKNQRVKSGTLGTSMFVDADGNEQESEYDDDEYSEEGMDQLENEFPSSNNNAFSAETGSDGGVGRLIISKDSPQFCNECSYLMKVEASVKDTVSFFMHKIASDFVDLYVGKNYPFVLKKDENQKMQYVVDSGETEFSINMNFIRGQVKVEYSDSRQFLARDTHVLKPWSGQEFFTVRLGQFAGLFEEDNQKNIKFLRISALADAEFEVSMTKNDMLTTLPPRHPMNFYLVPQEHHYYFYKSTVNEDVTFEIDVRDILGVIYEEMHLIGEYLPMAIQVYSVSDLEDVKKRNFNYRAQVSRKLSGKRLRLTTRGTGSYIVVDVKNIFTKVMYYRINMDLGKEFALEMDRIITTDLSFNHKKYYRFNIYKKGKLLSLQMENCLKNGNQVEASFFIKKSNEKRSEAEKRAQPFEGEDQFLDREGTGYIVFQQTSSRTGTLSTGSEDFEPSYIQFSTSIKSKEGEQDFQTSLFDQQVIDKVADSPEVMTNMSPVLQFDPVKFADLDSLLKSGHQVSVNYTVYVSKVDDITLFNSKCGNYDEDRIKKKLGDMEATGFSEVQRFSGDPSQDVNPFNVEYNLDMPMLTFGEIYYARLVAKVYVSEGDNGFMSFPRSRQAELRYIGVQFKAADYTWTLYIVMSLAVGTILVFMGVFCYKNQSWQGLMKYKVLRVFLSEFDTDAIGKQLEFEVMSQYSSDLQDVPVDYLGEQESRQGMMEGDDAQKEMELGEFQTSKGGDLEEQDEGNTTIIQDSEEEESQEDSQQIFEQC